MSKANPLMKIEDFSDLVYCAIVANTTTRTQVLNTKQVRILELTEKGALLMLPKSSCSKGHMLMIFVFPNQRDVKIKRIPTNMNVPNSVSFTAKVSSIEDIKEPLARVEVEFYQRVGGQWKKFTDGISERQKAIDKLIKAIKE